MVFLFDKGEATEKRIEMDSMSESIGSKRLSASQSIQVSAESVFPNLDGFEENSIFKTVEITDGNGISIPVVGTYNKIDGISVSYYEFSHEYQVNMSLAYAESN